MDYAVYLDAKSKEIGNILSGNKKNDYLLFLISEM